MPVKRVLIVRHGVTDYNAQHRWQGHMDVPLNADGKAQAEALAQHLLDEPLDAIFSSDLQRACDTARPIAKLKNLEIITDKRLREMHMGVFQGLTGAQIQEAYPRKMMRWRNDDNYVVTYGESRKQVQKRLLQAWQDIIKHENIENILVVSHGGSIRLLLQKIFPEITEQRLRFGNTAINILERDDQEKWQIIAINQEHHLK